MVNVHSTPQMLTLGIGAVFAVAWYYALKAFWEGTFYTKSMLLLLFLVVISSGFLLYAFRFCLTFLGAVIQKFLKPTNPQSMFDEYLFRSFVLPSDLDVFLHMNNARYGRAADFARFSYLTETGFGSALTKQKCIMAVTASIFRYRRSLHVLQRYTISTKLVYWDDDAFYIEQKFISDYKDIENFVYCVVIVKMTVRGDTIPNVFKTFLKVEDCPPKPDITSELKHFIDYNQTSSKNLRSETMK